MSESPFNTSPPQQDPIPSIPFARPVALDDAGLAAIIAAANAWPPPMTRLRALVELLLLVPAGLIGLFGLVGTSAMFHISDTRWYNLLSGIGMGAGALTACAIMMSIDRQRFAVIGWTSRRLAANVGIGFLGLAAIYTVIIIPLSFSVPQVSQESEITRKTLEDTFPPMSFGWLALAMTFIVIWEEVVFRGFVLTRLHAIFRRWWLVIPVAAVLFGSIHGYEGFMAMSMITVLALVMSILFIWRRSLVPGMVLHWVHNVGTLLYIQYLASMSN